jgi:uncharacterized protein (TIGR00369 family)
MLDLIHRMLAGDLAIAPVADLIGFSLSSLEAGRAVIRFQATPRHANPMGTLHGGVLCDIADAAMGMAYASTLGEGETFTTLELKINFLKRAPSRRRDGWSKAVARSGSWSATSPTTRSSWWRGRRPPA